MGKVEMGREEVRKVSEEVGHDQGKIFAVFFQNKYHCIHTS
jgi:hypothetical protein